MTFPRIAYLAWARRHMGTVRCDLARSNMKTLPREELPFSPADVETGLVDEGGLPALRSLLGERYGVPPGRVYVCNGATMGIWLACAALLQPGDEALVETPAYEPLLAAPRQLGVRVETLERAFSAGWQMDLEELERRVSRRCRVVLLTNPHNPSGALTNPEKMRTIGQIARAHGATVVASEVYLDNVSQPGNLPAVQYGDNLVSIGSLSKIYGLGGLRIGWVVGPEEVIERILAAQDYVAGGVSAPSQSLALLALRKAPELVERCRKLVGPNVKILGDWVRRKELAWVEPQGGTVGLVKLPAGVEAPALANLLLEHYQTLVVPGDFFGARGFLRIALGVDEETLRTGLKNLSAALERQR